MEVDFNEDEWMRILFLLSDTQEWLNNIIKGVIYLAVPDNKGKLFRRSYYISVTGLAHLLERHYYKISRHPEASKFTIAVPEILCHLRDAFHIEPTNISGSCNYYRVFEAGKTIGFDKYGKDTTKITVVTDSGGQIKTAFPGGCLPSISSFT